MRRITLLTDFGTRDGYVAAVKGVLASLAHGAVVEDASHDIPRGDVAAASRALGRYWSLYPRGTVHLVVVDPGVGTDRRVLALEARGRFVVAPDNGVAHHVMSPGEWRAVEPRDLPRPEGISRRSATFHGRDVFAPVAARLAQGTALDSLGPAISDPIRLPDPAPTLAAGRAAGRVVSVDRFGNLGTNLPGDVLKPGSRVEVAGVPVPVGTTYGDVEVGGLVALVNSDGRVEVAVRDGSAAERLGGGDGSPVVLLPETDGETGSAPG
jgi:hypothetical protein